MDPISHYKETIPKLINNMKTAINQCLEIVSMDIDSEISDDKLHAVLKAKRMAAEDSEFYAKRIDSLEKELNNVEEEVESTIEAINPVKKRLQQQK